MTNYYPWNIRTLIAWVKTEISAGKPPAELADELQLNFHTLKDWLSALSPSEFALIELDQIHAIARYRGWTTERTVQWLEIRPAHLAELKQQAGLKEHAER